MSNVLRHQDAHDDMLGEVRSAISGGTSWTVEVITGTPFVIGALVNNSTDMVQVKIQVPHKRKMNSVLDSIHIHYVLQAASGVVDQTVVFTGIYTWVQPGDAIPATASWTAMSGAGLTMTIPANTPVRTYGIHSVETNITCPSAPNESYGGMLLIQITRGNGTYTGRLGILDVDAHTIVNRHGSVNEASD